MLGIIILLENVIRRVAQDSQQKTSNFLASSVLCFWAFILLSITDILPTPFAEKNSPNYYTASAKFDSCVPVFFGE